MSGDNAGGKADIEKLEEEEEEGEEILKAEITQEDEKKETDTKLPPAKKEPISTLCDTMKRQIISRAFYGWLGHCRHMRVVRRHLTGLAFTKPVTMTEEQWQEGVTAVWWKKRREAFLGEDDPEERKRKAEEVAAEAYNRIYFGGIDPTIRKYVCSSLIILAYLFFRLVIQIFMKPFRYTQVFLYLDLALYSGPLQMALQQDRTDRPRRQNSSQIRTQTLRLAGHRGHR